MRELDLCSMQEISPQFKLIRLPVPPRCPGWSSLGGPLIGKLTRAAIKRVPDNGVADGGHVYADLVSAARFNAYLEEREWAETGLQTAHDLKV